eukprot:1107929_1
MMSSLLIVIVTYLTVVAAQFKIVWEPWGDYYYVTSREYKDDPKARIPLKAGDILLRKVVSPDGERDLYVGKVEFIGSGQWKITHTDSERKYIKSKRMKCPKEGVAFEKEVVEEWLNEPPFWDFGYAADANSKGYEYINSRDGSKDHRGEFIEKEGGTTRVWKHKRGHIKEPWNREDIGKDPTKREGFHFGRKKEKGEKNANVMGYDELLQDYDEDYAILRRIERDRKMLLRLERIELSKERGN